jgi:hypothetical protein
VYSSESYAHDYDSNSATTVSVSTTSTSRTHNGNNGNTSKLEISMLRDLPHPDMICDYNTGKMEDKRCCASWEINVDDWWAFRSFPKLANMPTVLYSLYASHLKQLPYQLSRRRPDMHWTYVGRKPSDWSWCPTTDLNCFILLVGSCVPKYETQGGIQNVAQSRVKVGAKDSDLIANYLLRYRHEVRRRIAVLTDAFLPNIDKTLANCTAIHVRRGDSGVVLLPYRRYAGLLEYIKAGNIGHSEPILVLTDDMTTIEEAKRFFPDYNWVYMNRARSNMSMNGIGGHVADEDSGQEFVVVQTEVNAASYCRKLVRSSTHFPELIELAATVAGREQPTSYWFDSAISESDAKQYDNVSKRERARVYIDQIYREAAEALRERMNSKNETTRRRHV